MKSKISLVVALMSLAFLGGSMLSTRTANHEQTVAQSPPTATEIQWERYQIPFEFSIEYPSGWYLERTQNPPGTVPRELLIMMNQPPTPGGGLIPADLIKTDISIEPGSFETMVEQKIAEISASTPSPMDGSKTTITERREIQVYGKDAVRLWLTNANTEMIVTIMRYTENETIYMASFYNAENPAAATIIEMIQDSVTLRES